jgi:hypothetical protein
MDRQYSNASKEKTEPNTSNMFAKEETHTLW